MKIKTVQMPYEKVLTLRRVRHKNPHKPGIIMRTLMKAYLAPELKAVNFRYDLLCDKTLLDQPCMIFMNHSSFTDLSIVSKILYPMPYNIICTSDGFVGKAWLMRALGCVPTNKFVPDVGLLNDIDFSLHKKGCHVLMYPEASYTFDGCATPLRRRMGLLLKRADVPLIFIRTYGAFARDPLYNCLQKRKVDVRAEVSCLLTREQIKAMSVSEIDEALDKAFDFDNFKWQEENNIEITEDFRADGLDRILYKCADCGAEGSTSGHGTTFECLSCGRKYTLDTLGRLVPEDGRNARFSRVPDWYRWEREQVREEVLSGDYLLDTEVNIGVMVNRKAIYMVGSGRLIHNAGGFSLTGCGGKLEYRQPPLAGYSLYSDFFWYEIGDMICIGNNDILYYCFPKQKNVAAKTRLAVEELYKICKASQGRKRVQSGASGDLSIQ